MALSKQVQIAVVLFSLVAAASALDLPIDWKIPTSGKPYDTTYLQTGDSVTFNWRGFHGVYKITSDRCPATFSDSGPDDLAPSASGGSYTWHATAPGTYYLACQVGDHCKEGMLIEIVVGSGPALAPSAMAPMVPAEAPAASGDSEGSEGEN
ncbi:hypothetical protein WJX73_003907 [Symbiochloris irregularis]|uniref:Phytocyanin domain-containing protein n=1 Tax=Symbiochloris irregularis TaxID=706552 RepID=A0AAW1NMS4_9CHLO